MYARVCACAQCACACRSTYAYGPFSVRACVLACVQACVRVCVRACAYYLQCMYVSYRLMFVSTRTPNKIHKYSLDNFDLLMTFSGEVNPIRLGINYMVNKLCWVEKGKCGCTLFVCFPRCSFIMSRGTAPGLSLPLLPVNSLLPLLVVLLCLRYVPLYAVLPS